MGRKRIMKALLDDKHVWIGFDESQVLKRKGMIDIQANIKKAAACNTMQRKFLGDKNLKMKRF